MATTRKEVELRITANDLGTKTLDELVRTFEDLKKAQEDFAKSGDVSSRSLRELKQDMTDLRAIGQQLASRGALIDLFDKTTTSVEAAAKKVHEAQQALAQFQATQTAGEALTRKQASEYANLQKSLQSAEKGFNSAASRAEALQAQLKTIGASDIGKAKEGLVSFANQVGDSLRASETAIRSYDGALREKRTAEDAATATAIKLAQAQREAIQMNEAFDARSSFNKLGRDAIAASNAIDVLTKDFNQLTASGVKGGDGIRAILDPAKDAIRTLDGLEKEIADVNEKLDKANSNNALKRQIKELRSEYLGLATDAGKSAAQIADDIGRYKQQEVVVNQLRERFVTTRVALQGFAEQMATANRPTDELKRSLNGAQSELAALATQVERESIVLAKLRASLQGTGVDVNNLAAAEARLKTVATDTASALDRLGASHRKVGESAAGAGRGLSLFNENGRTSLSLLQRLRGQVLALTATYTGLYGAINLITEVFQTQQATQGFEIKLRVANEGDLAATAADIQYVRAQADRLGVSFLDLGAGYSSFSIAARGAGVSLRDTRSIFEGFTEVSKVMRLSADDTKGVFKALEQIFSKGKVSAEELRGQLGDRLPGAFNEFAKSLGKSTEEVNKILTNPDKGIPSKFLLLFADQFRQKVAKELPDATKTLASEIARLKSTVADLLNTSANGNLETSLRDLIARINTFFRSDEGQKFASNLTKVFVTVFEVLRTLVDFVNEITTALTILFSLKIASFFVGMGEAALLAATGAGALSVALAAVGKALTTLVPIAAAFFVGFQIGKYLDEQFYIVHAASNNIAESIRFLMRSISGIFETGWETVKTIFYRALALLTRSVSEFVGSFSDKVGSTLNALSPIIPQITMQYAQAGAALIAQGKKTGSSFADGYQAKANEAAAKVASSNRLIEKELERFRSRQLDVALKDPRGGPIKLLSRPTSATSSDPTELANLREQAKLLGGGNDKSAKKLESLATSLQDDVSKIIQELEKSATGNLEQQLKAAEQRLALLRGKLNTLARAGKSITIGDETFSIGEVRKLVDEYQNVLEKRITEKFYQEQIKDNQKKFNDLIAISRDGIGEINDQVQAGLLTREQGLAKLIEIDGKYAESIRVNADKASAALRAMPAGIFDKLGGEKLIADINKSISGVNSLSAKTREDLFKKDIAEAQKTINDLLDVRRSKVELVNAEVNLGLKTQLQGQEEIRKINVQYSQDILDNAARLTELLNALPPDLFKKLGADKLIADLQRSVLDVKVLRTEAIQVGLQLQREFGEGLGSTFVTLGQELGKVLQKSQGLGDAFKNAGRAFQQFASDFLLKIAGMIAKQAFLNALQASGIGAGGEGGSGGIFGFLGKAVVGSFHGGGVIGRDPGAHRQVDVSWFANAKRFHGGGFPGLKSNEVPAILEKGERVLSKRETQNQASGGGTRIVNLLDPELARDFMESSAGEKVIMNVIRRNPGILKTVG